MLFNLKIILVNNFYINQLRMALQQTNHFCEDLQIAIKLFTNSQFSPCLIHIDLYLQKNITNVTAYDIKGTCLIKLNMLEEALKTYEYAREVDPNNLGIINNTVYILIQLGKYSEALQLLQGLEAQWHHPSIYQNLIKISKRTNNQEMASSAQLKAQNAKIIYRKIHVFQNGLIFNFLLDPKTTMIRSKVLQTQLIKKVGQIHKQPISTKGFRTLMDELKDVIQQLRNLEFKYGVIRPNHFGLISNMVQSYIKVMRKIWLDIDDKIEKQIYQHYHSEINEISNQAQRVFWDHYIDVKCENSIQINQKLKDSFNQGLRPIADASQKINELIGRDRQFLIKQNDSKKYNPPRCPQFNYLIKKDLTQFQQLFQQFKTKHEYCVTFQKGQKDPFFVILKPIKHKNSQQDSSSQNQEDLLVYLNIRKCLQRFDMTSQCRQAISKIQDQQKKKRLTYFYWSVTFLCKIYTWYSEGSLQITKTTETRKDKYYLSITELIQILFPLLDQIPKDEVQGIGHIVRTLHYSLLMFLIQCRNGPGDPLKNVIIQNITKGLVKNQNQISKTLAEVISTPYFLQLVVNLQKTVQTDYINWRVQLNLPNKYQTQCNSAILTNCLSLLIAFGYLQEDTQEKYVFMTSFVNNFVQTTRDSGRKQTAQEFYEKHHLGSIFKKGLKWLKWLII